MIKKYIYAGLLVAGSALCSYGTMAANGNGGPLPPDATGATTPNHGGVWYTAAINSDGSVAGCEGCNKTNTVHLGTGEYQVGFAGNVTAANGFARWVQVDTLTIGSYGLTVCTTADRAGLATGIYVACFNQAGTATDTSFFLFVAR